MKVRRLIHQQGIYRIIEVIDECTSFEDLKGDIYNPDLNPDVPLEQLKMEELAFEKTVIDEGVYGYVLEFWNPEIDHGWTHIDSCYGFVGPYDAKDKDYNHEVVDEFKGRINE